MGSGSVPSENTGTQKRRSTRIVQAVPITVSGVDALGQPFKERTTTLMVNCHGCKYQSKHYVPKNNMVSLEIPRPEASLPSRIAHGRVIWVQRPRAVRELFQIGLEFDTPGNVWGIAFPPQDWFPYPGDEPVAPEVPRAEASEATPKSEAPAPASAPDETRAEPIAASAESKIHLVPSTTQEAQLAAARQTAKMVAEAKETLEKTLRRNAQSAVNDEMIVVRQQLDAQLHDAVERAIKLSMERVSESAVKKLIQQTTERTSGIIEEARKSTELTATQLDAKIQEAVNNAVGQAAEQAAQQAAQQATAQNLKQAVEEAVERMIREREPASLSLGTLPSPEAAQQHLQNWKTSLEQTAEEVRNKSIEKTEGDVAAARQRWQQEFDAATGEASKTLEEKIAASSEAALAQAKKDISASQSAVSESLDSAIADAQKWIESFAAGVEQQRATAENARTAIEEVGRVTLDETRQKLDEMLSAQQAEASSRAKQAVAEKLQSIEPAIRESAQKAVERLSTELDQTLVPKLEAARRAAAELTTAGDEAGALQDRIRKQVQQALNQAEQVEASLRSQTQNLSQQLVQTESAVREKVLQASQQVFNEALERAKQESGNLPAEFEKSCRDALEKIEDEFDQKNTEAKHDTYEALSKAADWYQKKAQATMQSTLEKAVEQSTTSLRSRAAEISSLVASELDHYRRSYVEHSQAEIEEAAKEVIDRERGRMGETAEIAQATFTDRVQQVTAGSMRRFEEASREALEKARSDVEYTREQSLAEFEKRIEARIAQSVEQAHLALQSQLGPIVEAWEAKRQQQQTEWLQHVKKSADESIAQYKDRLENASNSWLLASATTLGQHSQAVLDTLAKSAEKRMRDTIAEVLAGIGDTLKDRLLGISTNFSSESKEDDEPPLKKN